MLETNQEANDLLSGDDAERGCAGIGQESERFIQPGLELKFSNLKYAIRDRTIIDDVSGTAAAGQMMAIMGPSGMARTVLRLSS